MRFLDTNIILRYLTGDDLEKQRACLQFMRRLQTGAEEVLTSESVIAEVVYVMRSKSHYGLTASEVAERLRPVVELRGIHVGAKDALLRALDLIETYPFLDFEDALSVSFMEDAGLKEIVSYDRGFDRVEGVVRIEP